MSFADRFVPGESFRAAMHETYLQMRIAGVGLRGIVASTMYLICNAHGWGLQLSKLQHLPPRFVVNLLWKLGLYLYGPETVPFMAEVRAHVTLIMTEDDLKKPGILPLNFLKEIATPKALEWELWRACRNSCVDLLADPATESDLRMFIDPIMLAMATYLRSLGDHLGSGPTLRVEAGNGATDYCLFQVLSLEAKRPGSLKHMFLDGVCTTPHLQTLCAMVSLGCNCSVVMDGERCVFHTISCNFCHLVSVVVPDLLSGLRTLAAVSEPGLAVDTMNPHVRNLLCILWQCLASQLPLHADRLVSVFNDLPLQTLSTNAHVLATNACVHFVGQSQQCSISGLDQSVFRYCSNLCKSGFDDTSNPTDCRNAMLF